MTVELAQCAMAARIEDGAITRLTGHGVEILRGLACLVRDQDWGTLPAENARDSWTETTFTRHCSHADGKLETRIDLNLAAAGIVARARLVCRAPLTINRAGFVVLHPIAGVAGQELTILHPGGRVETAAFPHDIAPAQPAKDIAGLSHEIDGIPVTIEFEGDVFEMEDQRNWTDASFKTYSRPLSLPRPYRLAPGDVIEQVVSVAVGPRRITGAAGAAADRPPLHFPAMALAAEPEWWPIPSADLLRESGAQILQVRVGPDDDRDWLRVAALSAAQAQLGLALELVGAPGDAAGLAAALAESGVRPTRVSAVSPDWLRSYQPGETRPPGPDPLAMAAAMRAAFPGVPVGTGLFTCFTELNRARPDRALGDVVSHGTAAIVHAADDRSVLQTTEALPSVFASARKIAAGRPLALGLCAIGMRTNPYGAGLRANPDGLRITMTDSDPRQGTDFAAAFAIAAYAAAAGAGAAEIALAAPAGPFSAAGPVAAAMRAIAHVAQSVPVAVPAAAGLTGIASERGAVLANTGTSPAAIAGRSLPPGHWLALPPQDLEDLDLVEDLS